MINTLLSHLVQSIVYLGSVHDVHKDGLWLLSPKEEKQTHVARYESLLEKLRSNLQEKSKSDIHTTVSREFITEKRTRAREIFCLLYVFNSLQGKDETGDIHYTRHDGNCLTYHTNSR